MKKHLRFVWIMILLTGISVAAAAGTSIKPKSSQNAATSTPPPPERYGGTVVVKFYNGNDIQRAPDRDRPFGSATVGQSADIDALNASLAKAGAHTPAPTFTRPTASIRTEQAEAERNAGAELPDLTLFFDMRVPDYRAAIALLAELRSNALVETAFARTIPLPPPTPDLSSNQTYFGTASSNGYDVNYAWSKPGGSGSRARLIDIEYDWTFDHEDLRMSATNLLWGELYTNYGPDHGTASIGISGALSNGFGMTGIIHDGSLQMVSSISNGSLVIAQAINQAVGFTAPGDVILIEQQDWSEVYTNYCPVELRYDIYSAILNATALGRVIIEPAGNGGLDLDAAGWGGIFQRSTRDSGAIMLGAGTATNRSRCGFSCYGSRIDIQGWGDWTVASLSYGDLYGTAATNKYTRTFAGTSSASALAAAIAAAIQSYARVNYGFHLPPALMRSTLVQSGYPQTFGLPGNIGPLPNLSNAFHAVDMLVLHAPQNVAASDGAYTNKITVTWSAVANATRYEVWRNTSDDSGSASKLSGADPTGTSYDDTSATAGATYYYWVKAANAAYASSFSASDHGFVGVVGPLITANGLVGNVFLNSSDPATIAIRMMNMEPYFGINVDWWVVALAGSSWYYLNSSVQWTAFDGNLAHCHPAYQGGLFNLPSAVVLQSPGLPAGLYTFWFAVDYPMDGILHLDGPILVDHVTITAQ